MFDKDGNKTLYYKKNECNPVMARSTLVNEIGSWNAVMRRAKSSRMIDKEYLFPKLTEATYESGKPTSKEVRVSINTYTDEQIAALDHWIRTQFLKPSNQFNRGIVATDQDGKVLRNAVGQTRSKKGFYLSRVNLYAAYWLLRNSGARVSEILALKYSDIHETTIKDLSHASEHNPSGKVFILMLKETKPLRKKATGRNIREVVVPYWLENVFNLVRTENPHHCGPDDFVINYKGKRRKSLQPLFEQVQLAVNKRKGKPIDCTKHEDGTNLDLRHLRSYFVSYQLLQNRVNPVVLGAYTGHGLNTVMQFYLSRKPSQYMMVHFGGHKVSMEQELLTNVLNQANPDRYIR